MNPPDGYEVAVSGPERGPETACFSACVIEEAIVRT
jgi:hypothetical protein